jgi:hypothetical protein
MDAFVREHSNSSHSYGYFLNINVSCTLDEFWLDMDLRSTMQKDVRARQRVREGGLSTPDVKATTSSPSQR